MVSRERGAMLTDVLRVLLLFFMLLDLFLMLVQSEFVNPLDPDLQGALNGAHVEEVVWDPGVLLELFSSRVSVDQDLSVTVAETINDDDVKQRLVPIVFTRA